MSSLSLLLATRPDGDTSVAAPVTAYRPRRRRRQRLRRDDRDDAHAAARTDHRGGLVCTRRHVDRRLSVVRLSPYDIVTILICVIILIMICTITRHSVSAFVWRGVYIIAAGHVQDSGLLGRRRDRRSDVRVNSTTRHDKTKKKWKI